MKISEESFFITSSASKSDKIFFKKLFRGEKEKEKAILFFHDSRLHSDVFNDFFQNILRESKHTEIYSFDLYGHGRSGGERMGPVSTLSLIQDVDNIVSKIMEITELPIYFVGVGFGASLILNYLSEYEKNIVRGIALFNPMLEIKLNFSNIEKLLSIDFTYGSSLRISSKQNVSELIFDSQKKVELSQDPLCFNYYTRGFLKTMRVMGKGARTKAYFVD
jgi:alpha-beta hydrolase superfamily lysophospholipase